MSEPYIGAMRDLNDALGTIGIEAVVIGGVAVSLIASPRYTEDVDAIILFDVGSTNDLLTALESRGFRPRFPGMAKFAMEARLVTVVHESTGIVVDIMLGCMPFEEEMAQRATTYRIAGFTIRLPSPEDLIVLKAVANRPKDQGTSVALPQRIRHLTELVSSTGCASMANFWRIPISGMRLSRCYEDNHKQSSVELAMVVTQCSIRSAPLRVEEVYLTRSSKQTPRLCHWPARATLNGAYSIGAQATANSVSLRQFGWWKASTMSSLGMPA